MPSTFLILGRVAGEHVEFEHGQEVLLPLGKDELGEQLNLVDRAEDLHDVEVVLHLPLALQVLSLAQPHCLTLEETAEEAPEVHEEKVP